MGMMKFLALTLYLLALAFAFIYCFHKFIFKKGINLVI